MGFDDLWEKYGEKPDEKRSEQKQKETSQPFEDKRVREDTFESEPLPEQEEFFDSFDRTKSGKGERSKIPGFFEGEDVEEFEDHERKPWSSSLKRKKGRRRFELQSISFGGLGSLPWLDIICILITIAMVVGVLLNFEKVTYRLLVVILWVVCNLLEFAMIIGVIVLLIWLITRRRPPRRRWWW